MSDPIDRQAAIKAADSIIERDTSGNNDVVKAMTAWKEYIKGMPPAQQTALTADDIETIRIHLSAFKEKLCNQGRWTEAEEYERLIQRLTGRTVGWIPTSERLPEDDVYVFATTTGNDVTIAERYNGDKWFINEGSTNATTDDITAWMPLPAPYRAEGEENR